MLQLNNLHKSYGSEILFEDVTLQLSAHERLGLMGRNGSGKTTLFRLITGAETPDEGSIYTPRHYRIGYLEQYLKFNSPTVIKVACEGLPKDMEHERYRAEEILLGLGFSISELTISPNELSGGFQVRLMLARTLVSAPNLLLLDEPTNYLDIVSVRWIERFLSSWKGELIVISHDRDFMDSVTTHTAMIHRKRLRKIAGSTDKVCEQIAADEEVYEKTRQNDERKRAHLESFIERFKAKNTKASAARSKMKALERMPLRDKLEQIADLDFRFQYKPTPAKVAMQVSDLAFSYDNKVRLIDNLSFWVGSENRIGVIGKNGKGKSTLLRILSGELTPGKGEIKFHPETQMTYFGQTNIDHLDPKLTIEEEIGASNPTLGKSKIRGVCGLMMFGQDKAEKKISVLSGGERSRVLLGKIITTPSNLILLDEPSNHLDMQSVEALVESIKEFDGAVIIVTHDEMILNSVVDKLIIFQGDKVEFFNGTYDEFLEKIGWEDENSGSKSGSKKDSTGNTSINKKDLRKLRFQIIQERSANTKPLKDRIDFTEAEIVRLEEELKRANEDMVDASHKQEIERCVSLSKLIKGHKDRIDKLFDELEKTTPELERLTKYYEEKLNLPLFPPEAEKRSKGD